MRKNQARLTAGEKSRLVAALKALKANGMYDMMVEEHRTAMLEMWPDPAHLGPAFFASHRECLRRFELDLKAVDSRVDLPYWDWSRDRSTTSSLWGLDFMAVRTLRPLRFCPVSREGPEQEHWSWTPMEHGTP